MMNNIYQRNKGRLIISLIGPPGSGKGSYGRHLAKALDDCTLLGMSDILRQIRPDIDLSSGKLIDDSIVEDSLNTFFLSQSKDNPTSTNISNDHHHQEQQQDPSSRKSIEEESKKEKDVDHRLGLRQRPSNYLLDGYPRTSRQLLESKTISIDAAILLAVPDFVCESKMLGRRFCPICQSNFNVNGVNRDGWILPPTLPKTNTVMTTTTNSYSRNYNDNHDNTQKTTTTTTTQPCSEEICGWVTRLDDNVQVTRSRLQTYHEHTDPIVQHFRQRNRLLELKPYHGFDDLPQMIQSTQEFFNDIRQE